MVRRFLTPTITNRLSMITRELWLVTYVRRALQYLDSTYVQQSVFLGSPHYSLTKNLDICCFFSVMCRLPLLRTDQQRRSAMLCLSPAQHWVDSWETHWSKILSNDLTIWHFKFFEHYDSYLIRINLQVINQRFENMFF